MRPIVPAVARDICPDVTVRITTDPQHGLARRTRSPRTRLAREVQAGPADRNAESVSASTAWSSPADGSWTKQRRPSSGSAVAPSGHQERPDHPHVGRHGPVSQMRSRRSPVVKVRGSVAERCQRSRRSYRTWIVELPVATHEQPRIESSAKHLPENSVGRTHRTDDRRPHHGLASVGEVRRSIRSPAWTFTAWPSLLERAGEARGSPSTAWNDLRGTQRAAGMSAAAPWWSPCGRHDTKILVRLDDAPCTAPYVRAREPIRRAH